MRRLTRDEIEDFSSFPDAQRRIVMSVLSTINSESSSSIGDLFFLARLQGWQSEIVEAIITGIAQAAIRDPDQEQGETSGQESLKSTHQDAEIHKPKPMVTRLATLRNSLLRFRASASSSQKPAQHRPRGGVLGIRDVKENAITPLATCLRQQEK